jgi:hypothetical protein
MYHAVAPTSRLVPVPKVTLLPTGTTAAGLALSPVKQVPSPAQAEGGGVAVAVGVGPAVQVTPTLSPPVLRSPPASTSQAV